MVMYFRKVGDLHVIHKFPDYYYFKPSQNPYKKLDNSFGDGVMAKEFWKRNLKTVPNLRLHTVELSHGLHQARVYIA